MVFLSNLHLEVKFIALFDKAEITSEAFIIGGIDGLPLLSIVFAIFQYWQDPSFLFSALARTACA